MRRPGATLEALLDMMMEGILIALLIFAPLAFGAVQTWALSLVQAGLVVLFALWLGRLIWSRPASRPARSGSDRTGVTLLGYRFLRTGFGWPVAAFLALVCLQLVPLPPGLLRAISPETAATYARSLPGYAEGGPVDFRRLDEWLVGRSEGVVAGVLSAQGTLPVEGRVSASAFRPLTLYPLATAGRLLTLTSFVMVFLAVAHCIRSRPQIERLCWVVTLLGLAMSVLGVVQRLQWNGRIYWLYPVSEDATPFGPFLNRNHFAAWLEMAIPLALGMFLTRFTGSARYGGATEQERGFWSWSGLSRRGPDPIARLGLSAFSAVMMLGALLMSGSRGAVLSLGAAVVLYGAVLLARRQVGRLEWAVGACALIAAIAFAAWIGFEDLAEMKRRLETVTGLEQEPSLAARMVGWSYTTRIVADYPVAGTGLGTFAEAWIRYYPPGTANISKEANNDYLQVAAETGLAGAAIFAWGLWRFLRRYLLRDPEPIHAAAPEDRYLWHGIAVGLLSILLHSLVDFGLQVAAIALLFVTLSAIMVGQAARSEEHPRAEGGVP